MSVLHFVFNTDKKKTILLFISESENILTYTTEYSTLCLYTVTVVECYTFLYGGKFGYLHDNAKNQHTVMKKKTTCSKT